MISYLGANLGGFDLSTTRGIQEALAALGYDPGPIDGAMGPKTKAAIQTFQRDAGLTADGIAGPLTKAAILERQYGSPPAVTASADLSDLLGVQQALQQLGYDPGPLDGQDGPMTRAAVKRFQSDEGLTVDGIAGPQTKAAIDYRLSQGSAPPIEIDSPPNPLPPEPAPVFIPPWWDETPIEPPVRLIEEPSEPLPMPSPLAPPPPPFEAPPAIASTTAAAAQGRADSVIGWAKANPMLAAVAGFGVLGLGWLALGGKK